MAPPIPRAGDSRRGRCQRSNRSPREGKRKGGGCHPKESGNPGRQRSAEEEGGRTAKGTNETTTGSSEAETGAVGQTAEATVGADRTTGKEQEQHQGRPTSGCHANSANTAGVDRDFEKRSQQPIYEKGNIQNALHYNRQTEFEFGKSVQSEQMNGPIR